MEESTPSYVMPSQSRKVALWVWIFPLVFSLQWIAVALATPIFIRTWSGFGAKLPVPTQFMIDHWFMIAAVGLIAPAVTLKIAIENDRRTSLIISILTGVCCMLLAQYLTLVQFMPLFQAGVLKWPF